MTQNDSLPEKPFREADAAPDHDERQASANARQASGAAGQPAYLRSTGASAKPRSGQEMKDQRGRGRRRQAASRVQASHADGTAADDAEGVSGQEPPVDDAARARAMEVRHGRELNETRDRLERWRVKQAREAFRTGDQWSELTARLSVKEVSAFLAAECQIPRRDVARFVRLAKVLGADRELYIEKGVAVSVLLDLAGQDEAVRSEALRMIRSGRSLQSKELRALKRDISLERAAAEGALDRTRIRDLRNIAVRKARAGVDAWLASLEKVVNAAHDVSEFDMLKGNTLTMAPKKIDRLAIKAAKLVEELPALVGREFAKAPVPDRPRSGKSPGSWPEVFATLRAMAKRRMFIEHRYERPETTVMDFDPHIVAQLAWAFGYDGCTDGDKARDRMREAGSVPLATQPGPEPTPFDRRNKPTVLEICAGAGGQALGLHAAGFSHAGLVEIDGDAAATLKHNRPSWPVLNADLRGLDLSHLKGVDLLAGGVPCQSFSAAGMRLGANDERDLFPEALRLVRELRPRAVMLENVTGALHVGNAVNRLRILSALASLGYDAEWRVIDGSEFGLPQKRRRSVLVGFQQGIMHRFRWPVAIGTPAPTVGEALFDLMSANGWEHAGEWGERANGLAPTLIGGSQRKKGIDLAQEKSRQAWMKIAVNPNGRALEAPGPGVPADHNPKLTLEMMARIQDFPEWWSFKGSPQQAFRQIANAFPPRMAFAVGASIMRALTGREIDLPAALLKPLAEPEKVPSEFARKFSMEARRQSAQRE